MVVYPKRGTGCFLLTINLELRDSLVSGRKLTHLPSGKYRTLRVHVHPPKRNDESHGYCHPWCEGDQLTFWQLWCRTSCFVANRIFWIGYSFSKRFWRSYIKLFDMLYPPVYMVVSWGKQKTHRSVSWKTFGAHQPRTLQRKVVYPCLRSRTNINKLIHVYIQILEYISKSKSKYIYIHIIV